MTLSDLHFSVVYLHTSVSPSAASYWEEMESYSPFSPGMWIQDEMEGQYSPQNANESQLISPTSVTSSPFDHGQTDAGFGGQAPSGSGLQSSQIVLDPELTSLSSSFPGNTGAALTEQFSTPSNAAPAFAPDAARFYDYVEGNPPYWELRAGLPLDMPGYPPTILAELW